MLGSSTVPATHVTLSKVTHFSEPVSHSHRVDRTQTCFSTPGRIKGAHSWQGEWEFTDALCSAVVGMATEVILVDTKQGGIDGLMVNEKGLSIKITLLPLPKQRL